MCIKLKAYILPKLCIAPYVHKGKAPSHKYMFLFFLFLFLICLFFITIVVNGFLDMEKICHIMYLTFLFFFSVVLRTLNIRSTLLRKF